MIVEMDQPLARLVFTLHCSSTFVHPESGRAIRLDVNLALYAWHGRHHATQIERLREREGW